MKIPLISALFACLLSGCAIKPVPIALSHDDTAAKVRFINEVKHAWIDLYPQNDCNNGVNIIYDNMFVNAFKTASNDSPQRVDMLAPLDPADRNVAEFSVVPGQRINIGVEGNPYRGCLGGISFIAAEKTQYEVILMASPDQQCSLRVRMLTTDGEHVKRTPVAYVRPMVCKRVL